MNRKYFNFIPAMLICIILALPVFLPFNVKAGSEGMVDPVLTKDGSLFPVVDAADLLTDEEENELAKHIYQVEQENQSAIVLVTVDTLGYKSVTDYNGYGFGGNHDGILFLIDMESRSWHITTTGSAIGIFTDSAQENLIDACKSNLSSGNYYSAFDQFVSACDRRFQSYTDEHSFTAGKFLICLLAGFLLALIPLFIFIAQLRTVHPQKGASNYSQQGLSLTRQHDRFVRKSVSRTKIQKESSGSSTHMGSSGTSHGGSSGHF